MKKNNLIIEDLFEIPTTAIYRPEKFKPITSVSIDSRVVQKDSLFVAIKGEKFDGHDFVREAIKKGASTVIINEKKLNEFNDLIIPVMTVKDTTQALGDLAKTWRNKLSTKIIGVTGSAGKTTTKEMLASILSSKYKVNKTIGNNNNHIGVPITLFNTNDQHDFLILEFGTNHFGEIAYTANIAQPDEALITNVGNSHLEFLNNKKGVLNEKIVLFETVAAKGGHVFINNDDVMLNKTMLNYSKRITYGFSSAADVKGAIKKYNDEGKPIIEITYKDKKFELQLNMYGEQSAQNFLSAAAVALKLGLNKKEISEGLSKFKPIEKRLNVRKFKKFILIDDTYNANPESMKYAIELMNKIKIYDKKIIVLGDMLELGESSSKLHSELSKIIKRNKINTAFLIGNLMMSLDSELKRMGVGSTHFTDRKCLEKILSSNNFKESVVLVKGSRGMKMEEFVKIITDKAHE